MIISLWAFEHFRCLFTVMLRTFFQKIIYSCEMWKLLFIPTPASQKFKQQRTQQKPLEASGAVFWCHLLSILSTEIPRETEKAVVSVTSISTSYQGMCACVILQHWKYLSFTFYSHNSSAFPSQGPYEVSSLLHFSQGSWTVF